MVSMAHIIKSLLLAVFGIFASSAMSVSAQTGIWNSAKHMTSGTISSIAQCENGYIWVGTEYGLNRYDGYRYTYYLSDSTDASSLSDNCVTALFKDTKGTLWVGTRHGLQRYDSNTDKFTAMTFDIAWQPRINMICSDPEGTLWCSTSGFGLWHFVDDKLERVHLEENSADDDYYKPIAFDRKGRLWTGDTRGRVACVNLKGGNSAALPVGGKWVVKPREFEYGEVISILPLESDSVFIVCEFGLILYDGSEFVTLVDSRGSMTFSSAMIRSNGQLVLGTLSDGLWQYPVSGEGTLSRLSFNIEEIDPWAASVRALFEDRSENLWLGCYQRGLVLLSAFDPDCFSWRLSEDHRPSSSELTSIADLGVGDLVLTLSGKGIYHLQSGMTTHAYDELKDAVSVCQDRKGNCWVATKRGIYSFEPSTGRSRLVLPLEDYNVRKLVADKLGKLYISIYGKGLLMFDPATGKKQLYDMFHPVSDDPDDRLCNDWILDLLVDSRGTIWCATASGVCCFDPRVETFCPFGWSVLHTDHLCQCLAEDVDGNILIGTNDGAYIYYQRTRQLSESPIPGLGLMSRSVSGIVCMTDRSIWMSTSRGIWLYDPDVEVLQPFAHIEGIENHEYNQGVAMLLAGGQIFFGHHDGFVLFDPKQARERKHVPAPAVLTAFVMDNNVKKPGDTSGGIAIYNCNVTEAHEFTLAHDENSFVMEFASLKFDLVYRPLLQYSIDGGRWQDAVNQSNVIPFYHMPPGKYQIRVRAMYMDAYSPESVYTIHIRQPWYATWWMNTIYLLLLLGFAGVCFMVWLRHRRMQIEDDKMNILIDATHDIRTPLTLILSPLHQLSERYRNDPDTSRKLQTIDHNSRRILMLVNQILDVRRYDKGQMPFSPQPTDMVRVISDNLQGFLYEAQQRKITLYYRHDVASPFNVMMDRTQFEKVIVNLLGNALKFTPDGGEIEISLTQEGQHAVMRVSDTGIGLPEAETERIFHRFYQSSSIMGGEGTGIGLNLCLKIVQLHGGTITASVRTDVESGSIFTVMLPITAVGEHVPEVSSATTAQSAGVVGEHASSAAPQPVRQPSRSQRLLLVDDDKEITEYITNELSNRYHCQSCSNGYEALQLLLADPSRFDVLISDIMMPEMDGLTLLRSVKSNNRIAHIPVILLTSKDDIAHRLEGLSAGADAYLAKPFVLDELRATIDGLIANALRVRSKFVGQIEAAKASAEQAADMVKDNLGQDNDSKLLERVIKVVNLHLSDADFGVDELCIEVGVSRSQLHRKMKELTGIGAGEFIRNIRLEQAARLLKETDMNVSQVAYAVGFSNLGHFSKIFRTHFGEYPSDYGA